MAKPTFTRKVSAGTRLYYFDVHTDKNGSEYLSVTEVPTSRKKGDRKRQRIFIHPEDIHAFLEALMESSARLIDGKCQ
jgi:hypothetical protein